MADKEKSSSVFSDQEREAMRERARKQREFKKLPGEEQVQMSGAEEPLLLTCFNKKSHVLTKTWMIC